MWYYFCLKDCLAHDKLSSLHLAFLVFPSFYKENKGMCWTLAILGNYQLTLLVPIPDEEKKIKLNFYFHTPLLWCLKRFYQGLKGLYKTF